MLKFKHILNELMSVSDYGGWLLPDGKFVKIDNYKHSDMLRKLAKTPKYRPIFVKNNTKYDISYENAIANGFTRIVNEKELKSIGVEVRQDKYPYALRWIKQNAPPITTEARFELYDEEGKYVQYKEVELN